MKRNANPAETVAVWNSAYPAGTEVDYRFHRAAAPKRTRTTTEAQVLGGHTAVVWLAGVSGCVIETSDGFRCEGCYEEAQEQVRSEASCPECGRLGVTATGICYACENT